MKTKKKDLITIGKSKQNVSKFNRHINAWTQEEDLLVVDRMSAADYKRKEAIRLGKELNRTTNAVISRNYYLIKNKTYAQIQGKEEPKLDTSFIGIPKKEVPSFIPETPTDLFLEEVSVTMYKSLDGSLHEKAQDAVKANIRTIIDSIPDKDSDDRTMHLWFVENKEKVNYLTNINVEELW